MVATTAAQAIKSNQKQHCSLSHSIFHFELLFCSLQNRIVFRSIIHLYILSGILCFLFVGSRLFYIHSLIVLCNVMTEILLPFGISDWNGHLNSRGKEASNSAYCSFTSLLLLFCLFSFCSTIVCVHSFEYLRICKHQQMTATASLKFIHSKLHLN